MTSLQNGVAPPIQDTPIVIKLLNE